MDLSDDSFHLRHLPRHAVLRNRHATSVLPICTDDRQFVGWEGQSWTTLEKLRETHKLTFEVEDDGVTGIGIAPHFAIGQRALLVRTPHGNVLWDCVALVDDEAVRKTRRRAASWPSPSRIRITTR